MMHIFKKLALIGSVLVLGQMAAAARAQENLPALSFEPSALRQEGASGAFSLNERPEFNFDNPYLNDTLSLQYQNILLEKMILRQSAIARTEQSFLEVGVPFDQPAPPRGICEQLPVNVPCYKAYPDLFPGAVAQAGQIEEGALGDMAVPVLPFADISTPPRQGAAAPKKAKAEKPAADFSAYRWAEITCAGGRCSAVIVHNGARRGVRQGDKLGEGVEVARITATGVELSQGGRSQQIEAALAPSRGGAASPKYASLGGMDASVPPSGSLAQQAQQIQEQFAASSSPVIGEVAPPESAVQQSAEDSVPDMDLSDPGPPLGETGLF